jgi:hypothetical protein
MEAHHPRKDQRLFFRAVSEYCFAALIISLVLFGCQRSAHAQTERLVVIKLDGLPNDTVDRFVRERDPRTGKSQLPWIDHIFYQGGTRLTNFYVRGVSLSGPSWSMLETGQHMQIKGNVEFDRYTLHAYDYLHLIPYYMRGVTGSQVDMPGVEVLDSIGVPLMVDAYPHSDQYRGISIYQRGARFLTFPNALQNRFKRSPKELFDEWTMGLELRNMVADELVKELIERLNDPNVRYLDLLLSDFDHVAHGNSADASQLEVLKHLDEVIGQVWTAIQKSPNAGGTVLSIVSDHGMNSDSQIYSQGFNLVKWLGSAEGGGHHVVTKRRLLLDYSIKGIMPFYFHITTSSRDSYYLKDQGDDYPTAVLDFDGNERAAVYLRDSDLNLLQIILQQLQRRDLPPPLRQASTAAFFSTLDRRRSEWQEKLDQLNEELGALRNSIDKQDQLWREQSKKFSKEDIKSGRNNEVRRIYAQLSRWKDQEEGYSSYARALGNLLGLRRDDFQPLKIKAEDLISRKAMGEQNNVHQLQNYVIGVSETGFVLNSDGSLDMQKSFTRVNYLPLLQNIAVRNNVQASVSNHPIDFVARPIPANLVRSFFDDLDQISNDAVWLYCGPDRQAIIFARENGHGQLSLLYRPIKNLEQDAAGRIRLEPIDWQAGLPLHIFEDPAMAIAPAQREEWLSQWHTDLEWLQALHRTQYSNGIVGLYETLGRNPVETDPAFSQDGRLMQRFAQRQRELVTPDLLVLANNHWNFDVRGFNPGGNHGSFFRISTHATWMLAGGDRTGVPRGLAVDEPYDSLSFVPTLLALTGKLRDDMSPVPILWEKGFRHFPGRVVKEVISNPSPAVGR